MRKRSLAAEKASFTGVFRDFGSLVDGGAVIALA